MANWRSYIDPSIGDGQNTIDGIIANGATYGLQISDDLSVTGLSTFSDIARFSSTVRLDGQLRDGDNAFGTSGQVLSSDGTDTRWINAGELSAGAASQVAVNDDSNTNAERFITIVASASGNNSVKTDASLKYNPSTNTITTVNITGNVTGNLTGNVTGNVTGDISGNSGTATILQTSRTIGGVSFNGSAAINLPGVNISGNQNTSGNAATATTLQTARTIGGVSFNGSADINLPGVNQSGNQNTSGNAATATVLETTRAFSITGEVTANSINFNGSGNVSLNAIVNDNIIDYDNLKASNRTSATNGQYLRKRSGNTGGMTWEDIPVVTGSNLTGNTLSSNIVSSSLTSLGTLTGLTVNGNVSITGALFFGSGSSVNLSTNDIYLNARVIQNATGGTDDGLYIGYANASSGHTRIYGGGSTTGHFAISGNGNNDIKFLGNNVYHSGNDGSGSGLDADKLDGQEGSYYRNAGNLNAGTIPDARLANSSLFVTGMILMYTGSTAPSGWAICNGQNGTPDLRDRFVVGAGSAYAINNTGGSKDATLVSHSHTINNHVHGFSANTGGQSTTHSHTFSGSGSQSHGHNFTGVYGNDHNDSQRRAVVMRNDRSTGYFTAAGGSGVQDATVSISISGNTGNNSSDHHHFVSGNTGDPSDRGTDTQGSSATNANLPPYYALMFIMKL